MQNSHKYTSLKLFRKVSLKFTKLIPFCEHFQTVNKPNSCLRTVSVDIYDKSHLLFCKQEQAKDGQEIECKNETIGSTVFSFSSTRTSEGGLFGNTSGTGFGASSSLFGQKATTGFGKTGVKRLIA